MSKRIASAWSQLLLIWASCHPAMTTTGVQGVAVVASRGTSTSPGHDTADRPLNILFLSAAKTELAAAHPGMKWLAQQRDGDGKKKYNVAYLFAAAQLLAGDGSGVVFTEMSAEENGWLLPSQGNQEGAGVHPLDAQDVPENMPALGDHESLAKIVDSQNQNMNNGGLNIQFKQFDRRKDRITQEMQPAASELKELKSAGVHLIPYRLLGGGPTGPFPFLTPEPYADYVKKVVFESQKIDLVVFDMLAASESPSNIFFFMKQDLRKDFFPLLGATTFVRWAGNQNTLAGSIHEIAAAPAVVANESGGSSKSTIPKGPVLSATFVPELRQWDQIGTGAQLRSVAGKNGGKSFPLYYLSKNAHGASVNVGPIGLVMQHPAEDGVGSDDHQRGGRKKFAQNQIAPPAAAQEDSTVQKILDRLDPAGAGRGNADALDGLIYVAFGQQGNGFSKEGVRYLVRELVAASPKTLVYLVRPKLLLRDAAEGDVDAFFGSLPDEDIAQGRLLVHETERAPQLKIFHAFAPRFGKYNKDEKLKFSFLTHGGAGSLSDALGLSIPLLCLPLFQGDQPDNCAVVGKDGLGRDLGKLAMLMALQGFMAPVMVPVTALNLMIMFQTVGKLIRSASPGHRLTGENGQPLEDRTPELRLENLVEDLGSGQAELLRRFYQQVEDFRAPILKKAAADADAFRGPKAMDASFMLEKEKEWRALAVEKFTQSSGSSGFSGLAAGVLQAEAALLNGPGPTKMRSAVLRAIRANMTAEKLGNTLSRDADVGPLLAQFAEMKNPTAGAGGDPDGWFKIAEVGAGGRVEPTETEVRSESEEAGNASGLPGWAIALIVVGSVLVVAALLVTLLCCCCCCRG